MKTASPRVDERLAGGNLRDVFNYFFLSPYC
jgi:hypothetical protein